MSAAFALEPTGPPVPCDFRGCVLDCWHEGDHDFAPKPKEIKWNYDRHCIVCGIEFTVLGAGKDYPANICGSQECLLHYAQRFPSEVPLLCACSQRPYPHELRVHSLLRSEKPGRYIVQGQFRGDPFSEEIAEFASDEMRWPWSLMLSKRVEMSTERKVA